MIRCYHTEGVGEVYPPAHTRGREHLMAKTYQLTPGRKLANTFMRALLRTGFRLASPIAAEQRKGEVIHVYRTWDAGMRSASFIS
jgi:hypothetical protein